MKRNRAITNNFIVFVVDHLKSSSKVFNLVQKALFFKLIDAVKVETRFFFLLNLKSDKALNFSYLERTRLFDHPIDDGRDCSKT